MEHKNGLAVVAVLLVAVLAAGVADRLRHIKPDGNEVAERAAELNATLRSYTEGLEAVLADSERYRVVNKSGSLSNFEGPGVEIAYLSHHGEIWEHDRGTAFTHVRNAVKFDPDHADYGLPDLWVEVSQPVFVNPLQSGVAERYRSEVEKYLPGIGKIRPVESYTKRYQTKNGTYKTERFDLYLTEFDITIGVKPLRSEPQLPITREEKRQKIFPRKWYQDDIFKDSSRRVSISDFRDPEEYKNKRYSKLAVVFKVDPNPSAWYIDEPGAVQVDPKVAVGSLVIKSIQSNIKVESAYKEAHLMPGSPGMHITMYRDRELDGIYPGAEVVQRRPDAVEAALFDGAPVYFRMISENIGSWDDRLVFWGEEWDDQFRLKVFMPLLVKGTFDVTLDASLIPKYEPPEAYRYALEFSDLLPDWNWGGFGRLLSYLMLGTIAVVVVLFLPNLLALINAIFGAVARIFRSGEKR